MKKLLIHLGPHKTGSTAIQRLLQRNAAALATQNISFVHSTHVHSAAMDLANENYESGEKILTMLSRDMFNSDYDNLIISQEDFAGHLIGRSNGRKIYPKLTKHLRILQRSFRDFDVSFLFFTRNEERWLRSCYVQNLKYRAAFSSFENFEKKFGADFKWSTILSKPKEVFHDHLHIAEYQSEPTHGFKTLLNQFNISVDEYQFDLTSPYENVSPSDDIIAGMEQINKSSDHKSTAWFAKKRLLDTGEDSYYSNAHSEDQWPPKVSFENNCSLPALANRASARVHWQDIPDILPDINVDLVSLAKQKIPDDKKLPNVPRADIKNQSRILEYHFRKKSRLAHLNALTISYLRRDSNHTLKAKKLFHRIWNECGLVVVNELSTRWLISVLQTYLDHGINEQQKLIGATGYFYGNMMKIYEGERAIEGHPQDTVYENSTPQTKNEFRGLDRFELGGTDLMLNTNALALELARKDPVAGLVLEEFLLRVKNSKNVFSRMDRSRAEMKIDRVNFSDTWCFFEKPKKT